MSLIKVTGKDREWVRTNYPGLTFHEGIPAKLVGALKFRAIHRNGLPEIRDEYQIEIEFSDSETSSLPRVRETGGRLKRVAAEKGVSKLGDLHVNTKDGILCLGSPLEEGDLFSDGFSLEEFFSGTLVPFLYSQSYFETNDKWPWEHYSHGCLGLLESYGAIAGTDCALAEKCLRLLKRDQRIRDTCQLYLTRKGYIKGHWPCICGSSLIFRKCHSRALEGLRKLKQDVSNFSIDI